MISLETKSVSELSADSHALLVDSKEIYLIPIEHLTDKGLTELKNAIDYIKPDTFCIELSQTRYDLLNNNQDWQQTNITKVILEDKWIFLISELILINFIRKLKVNRFKGLGEQLLIATNIARTKQLEVVFVDQDINTMTKLAWHAAKFKEKCLIIYYICYFLLIAKDISKHDSHHIIKSFSENSLYTSIQQLFCKKIPALTPYFEHNRIQHITNEIHSCQGQRIIAYVHEAHIHPIKDLLTRHYFQPEENIISVKKPNPHPLIKKTLFIIPIIILSIFTVVLFKSKKMAFEMITVWILSHGFITFLSALIAGAHPLTLLSCWIAAPVISIAPFIGTGLLLMIIEAFARKPKVKDVEYLIDDIKTLKGFFQNRVLRLLLIFISTSIGALLGAFTAISLIARLKLL